MNKSIIARRWQTAVTVGLAGTLLLGGCASTEEAQHNAVTGVSGATASQEAIQHPFPSNGVKDDGYGVFLQSSIDSNDPAMKLSRNLVGSEVWNYGYTEDEVQEAQAVVLKFVSEEGIDSIMRAPQNAENQQMWETWKSDNEHWFIEQVKFVMDDEMPSAVLTVSPNRLATDGWPNGTVVKSSTWKEQMPFEYKYGKDSMRMTNRVFTPGKISLYDTYRNLTTPIEGVLTIQGTVQYALASVQNGTDAYESDTARYRIDVVPNEAGEWKIAGVSMHGSQD